MANKQNVSRQSRMLSLVYQNVRGLNTKLNHFNQMLMLLDCDLIAVTESFLTSAVLDSEVVCGDWSVLRRDRVSGMGGGVLIAAGPDISLTRCYELETQSGEDLWARVMSDNVSSFYLCVVYIPPNSTDETYMRWFQKVESVIESLKDVVIVVGDLNLNPKYTSLNVLNYYGYFTTVCGLTDRNCVCNAYGVRLDVVLVSEIIDAVDVCEIHGGGLVPRRDAYHPPLEIAFPSKTISVKPVLEKHNPSNIKPQRDWNFSKGNYELLYELVSQASWQEVLSAQNVDTAVENFYHVLYNIFDTCIPSKHRPKKPSRRYPVWFSSQLILNIKHKSQLHRLWKSTKNPTVYSQFSTLRADIKQQISLAYKDYITNIQTKLRRNPRAFWQHIGNLKDIGGFESRVTYQGKEYTDVDAAKAFSSYFASVFLPDVPILDHNVPEDSYSNSANFVHIDSVTPEDIETINKLKSNSAVGPDNIPAYVVKGCKTFLKPVILHILNLAISNSHYPHQWKISRVQPIPKTRDTSKVENYRPIAILSCLAKVFESILHKHISAQVQPYLCDSQHGFRFYRSVDTNLVTLVDLISQHLDKGIQVDVLYFDFQKAFDRVDNDILLRKLCLIGFTPKLLKLFASYLRDRQQFVRHGCFVSPLYHTRSGVSQGSILGPLLFGIMVNDLESALKHTRCLLYADDLKLVCGIQENRDALSMQRDIDSLFQWSITNKLHFNTAKCSVMSFSRAHCPKHVEYNLGGEPIERVNAVRDLGVLFDARLNFHDHMRALAADSYRRLGFVIRNMRDFNNPLAIKLIYMAHVRSKLESSAIVWNPYESTYALLLERVQKAFLRFFYKKRMVTIPIYIQLNSY